MTVICLVWLPIAVAQQSEAVIRQPYDVQIYTLAYQTFLANSNLDDAFAVAEAAVKQEPSNLVWRKRLATVSVWLSKPKVAFEQWLYLARHQHDEASIQNAIKFGKYLHQDEALAELYLMQIHRNTQDKSAWRGYIAAEESRGEPQYAVPLLKQQIAKDTDPFYLQMLATLYERMGDSKAALKTLKHLHQAYQPSVETGLKTAELYYSKGKLPEAFQALSLVASKATVENAEFWRTYAEIAWLNNHLDVAERAYRILYQTKEYNESDLLRLLQLTSAQSPVFALRIAAQGWETYQKDYFLTEILRLAPQQKKWSLLETVLDNLPATFQKRYGNTNYFLSAKAALLLHQGQLQDVVALYQQAIRRSPKDLNLKTEYLWFLIDHEMRSPLQSVLQQWAPLVDRHSELLTPFIAGYSLLGNSQVVLALYGKEFPNKKNNAMWLLNYSYALDDHGYTHLAERVRSYAWYQVLSKKTYIKNLEQRLAYARLAIYEAPPDMALNRISSFKTGLSNKEVNDVYMTWALSFDNYELASYVMHYQPASFDVAPWMRQMVALHDNDRDVLLDLLEHHLNQLPHRDRVLAAERIGNEPLAQELAYQGMKKYPNDSRMYAILKRVDLKSADYIKMGFRFRRVGYAVGPEFQLAARLYPTPRFAIMPWVNVWQVRSHDNTQLVVPMQTVRDIGVKISRLYSAGAFIIGIGQGKGLNNYLNGFAQLSHRWNTQLNTKVLLGINQIADDSTALLLGGKQQLIRFDMEYSYSQRDYIHADFEQHFFYTQDNHRLGTGQTLNGYFEHKFAFAYPDWHVNFFGALRRYQAAGVLKGRAVLLIPDGQTPKASFYIPNNALEYGVSLGYGEAYMEEYTHAWRTYGNIGVFENTDAGVGGLLTMGIAGSVFGRDHLNFYVTGSDNQEDRNQLDYILGMDYQLYF